MPDTGTNFYLGEGGLANVDFTSRVGFAASGEVSVSLAALGLEAGKTYILVARPVAADLERPGMESRIEVVIDGGGEWVGVRPAPVSILEAEILSGAEVRLRWHYQTPAGETAPNDFGVYYASAPGIALGSPDETESYTADGEYTKTLSLVDATTYWFAITARTATPVESDKLEIGPFLADDTAPSTPTLVTGKTFEG